MAIVRTVINMSNERHSARRYFGQDVRCTRCRWFTPYFFRSWPTPTVYLLPTRTHTSLEIHQGYLIFLVGASRRNKSYAWPNGSVLPVRRASSSVHARSIRFISSVRKKGMSLANHHRGQTKRQEKESAQIQWLEKVFERALIF